MKKPLLLLIILMITALILSACGVNQPVENINADLPVTEEETPETKETAEEISEPAGEEGYPAPETEGETTAPQNESAAAAYPITEDAISLLTRTWALTSYAENTIASAVPDKTLTLNNDGTYEIVLDNSATTGIWEIFLGPQANLVLDPGTDQVKNIQVLDLTQDMLQLEYALDGVQINEQYQPVE